jgi:hypothetical protein
MEAGGAYASAVKGIPFKAALADPFVFFARRPVAERAADAWAGCVPVLLNVVVGRNGSISLWTHAFGSLNSLFFGKAAPIPPDHAHFLATESSVLDCHAEKRVLLVLIVCGKRILMEQH